MTAVAMSSTDLVEPSTVALPNDARARAERIRVGIHSFVATRREIADAYRERDWLALGYESWEQYVDGEFTESRLKLTPDERREAVAELRIAGMSQRAISATLGVSQSTVRNDVAQVSTSTHLPTEIAGADGKTYASSKPVPSMPERKPAPVPTDEQRAQMPEAILGVLAEADSAGLTDTEVWTRLPMPSVHFSWVLPVIQELADAGRVEPAGRALRGNVMKPLWAFVAELDGVGDEYRTDPAERIAAVAEVAPEFVRPAEPDPQALVAAALDRFAPDLDAGARMWRRDLHAKLRPAHHVTLWIDVDDAGEFASDDDVETIRQLSLSFADLHRRILAARNGNVVQLRAVQ